VSGSLTVVLPGAAWNRSVGARRAASLAKTCWRRSLGPRVSVAGIAARRRLMGKRVFLTWTACNPLKSRESDEGIQENPSPFSWSGMDWLGFGFGGIWPEALRRRPFAAGAARRVDEARRPGRSEIHRTSYVCRQMAPQRLEKIVFAPGNGMAPASRSHNIWCEGDYLSPPTDRRRPSLAATPTGGFKSQCRVAARAAPCREKPESVIASDANH
jgi:hypothetical protein